MAKINKPGLSPEDLVMQQELLELAARASASNPKAIKQKTKDAANKDIIPKADAKKWRERIRRSEKLRKDFQEDSERFARMYQGDYRERPDKKGRYDQMNVNMVYSHIEIVTAAVFSGFPFIKVRPRYKPGVNREAAELAALNAEATITYWFKELATDDELKDVLFDTFFGHAGMELGWETELLEKEEKVGDPENDGANAPGGDEEDSGAIVEGDGGTSVEPTEELKVAKDQPFIIRRDPWDIYFDPDARRRRECRWIALRDVITYNYFLESEKFTEKAKKKVKPQVRPENKNEKNWQGREESKSEKEWIEIYTIWDKENMRKYVITDKYDGFLNTDDPQGEEWPYELEYKDDVFPIAIHDAKRDRKCAYTWSEFRAYEAQILEINRIRSAIQIHVKRTLPKYTYAKGSNNKHQIAKLTSATSDQAVELDNPDAVKVFENADIPPDLYKFNEMSTSDYMNTSGINEYQRESSSEMTATEAQIREGQSQVRKSQRSKQWEQFVVEVASKLLQLCQQFMDSPISLEIAGPNGSQWMDVTKEQIQGEFDFDIEPGVMEYKNETLHQQQLMKFLEITQNDSNVNRRKLIQKAAKGLDIAPEEVLLTPEEVSQSAAPPEPSITFKDIDPESIEDPAIQMALVLAGLAQNGVQYQPKPQAPVAPPLDSGDPQQAAMSGKDGMSAGANGDPNMPPVQGNLQDQNGGIV